MKKIIIKDDVKEVVYVVPEEGEDVADRIKDLVSELFMAVRRRKIKAGQRFKKGPYMRANYD